MRSGSNPLLPFLLTFAASMGCAGSPAPAPAGPAPGEIPAIPPRRPGASGGGAAGTQELEHAIKLADSGDLDGAKREAKAAIEKNPQLEKAYLLLGSACAMKVEIECEESAYESGVRALPRSAALLNERGLLKLRLEDKKGAIVDLEGAHELSGKRDPKFMADLAYAYIFVDRLEDAATLVVRAREIDPKSVEAAMAQGEVLLRRKDGKKAAEAFRSAAEMTSDEDVKARLTRQLALALSLDGQHKEALAIYEGILKQAKEPDALLHVQIAGALMKLNRAKEAVTHMERALKMEPDNTRFLGLLLQTQEKAGDKRGAEKTRKRLTALGGKS